MERTYISKQIMLAMGEPIGDPHGFGKCEMPYAAIAAAVGTIGTALGGGAVIGGAWGIAGAAMTIIATVATVVGLGMTIVGAVTGNKDLMKIGAYVGLAGGVAGLGTMAINAGIASAGLTTTAATAAPAASDAAVAGSTGGLAAASGEVGLKAITPSLASAGSNIATTGVNTAAGMSSGLITPTMEAGLATVPGGTGLVGKAAQSAISESITPALTSMGPAVTDVATPSINTLSAGAKVVSQGNDFFAALLKPETLLPIAGSMMKGLFTGQQAQGTQDIANKRLALETQMYNTQQANANVQGRLNMQTTPLSQQQLDQAALLKQQEVARMAQLLKQQEVARMAQLLTPPAGTK